MLRASCRVDVNLRIVCQLENRLRPEWWAQVRGGVCGLAFSPEGDILALGGWDAMVTLIDVGSGDVFARLGHQFVVSSLSWSPDSQHIVTGRPKPQTPNP